MISRPTSLIRSLATAAAICVAGSAAAQLNIRVEESTSSISRRSEEAPIDIRMPGNAEQKVLLTTATANQVEPAVDPDQSIDLTPAEFRAVQTPQPVAEKVVTPTPEPEIPPASDAPSGIPVPTDEPVSEIQDDSDPVAENDTEPASLAPTTSQSGEAAVSTDEEASAPVGSEVKYLPPADIAEQSVLTRDGVDIPTRPEQLTSAPLAITVPDVFQTTLTNGIKFYHFENRELPRIRVTMLIEAGKNADSADKVGLAEITARTIRSGGAGGKSGDEIDQRLEHIGSDLEFKVDTDHVAGSMFALTEKADEAMKLLADVLIRPEFNEKKFEQQRERALEELRRQNDQPAEISRREFRKIIYGADHQLARTPTSASISAISLDDVREFHQARYRPSTLWIGISGDVSRDDARKLVETAFGAWDRPPAEQLATPTLSQDSDSTAGVYLTKKATAQSQIRIGHLGLERRSPKAYAVNVLNSIYGTGGFSSRLMNEVRTKHGYVYGVGGGIFSDDPIGLFAAVAASQAGTTAAAIKAMIKVTFDLVTEDISPAEMETARRDVVFSFVTQFDTPHETVAVHMLYDYRGYEDDYLKTFPDRIRNVTLSEVKQVAKDLINPYQLKVYVIGNEAEFDEAMSIFGSVHEWLVDDYSE